MTTPELIDYVRTELRAGNAPERVRAALVQSGWTAQDIADAFAAARPNFGVAARSLPTNIAAPQPHAARKALLSLGFIFASGAYALWVTLNPQQAPIAQALPQPSAATPAATLPAADNSQLASNAPPPTSPRPDPTIVKSPAAPTPAPKPKPSGQYVDGSYTGSTADAYYGTVQVRATVSGGKLANVTFLQYPNDRSTSRYINSQAMPALKQEAIAAQSARVDIVSGATDTSMAFQQSLASALAQAKA